MKVGVVMPIGPQDGTGVVPPWEATRVAALATEEAGFDSAWVYDHLLFRFGTDPAQGIHECWTVLSAMAAITSRVELGILVLAMPFRNPGLLAKMANTHGACGRPTPAYSCDSQEHVAARAAAETSEVRSHYPDATHRASGPAAVADQADDVLGDQHPHR